MTPPNRPPKGRKTRTKYETYPGDATSESKNLQEALIWELGLHKSRHLNSKLKDAQRQRYKTQLQTPQEWTTVQDIARDILSNKTLKVQQDQHHYEQGFFQTHMKENTPEPRVNPPLTKPPRTGLVTPSKQHLTRGGTEERKETTTARGGTEERKETTTEEEDEADRTKNPSSSSTNAPHEIQQLEEQFLMTLTQEQKEFMEKADASTELTRWIDMTIQERLTAAKDTLHAEMQQALSTVDDLNNTIQEMRQEAERVTEDTERATHELQEQQKALDKVKHEYQEKSHALQNIQPHTARVLQDLAKEKQDQQNQVNQLQAQLESALEQKVTSLRNQEESRAPQLLLNALQTTTMHMEEEFRQKCQNSINKTDNTMNTMINYWFDDINQQYEEFETKAQDLIDSANMNFGLSLKETVDDMMDASVDSFKDTVLNNPDTTSAIMSTIKHKVQEQLTESIDVALHQQETSLQEMHDAIKSDLKRHHSHMLQTLRQQSSQTRVNTDPPHRPWRDQHGHTPTSQQSEESPNPMGTNKTRFMSDHNVTWDATTDEDDGPETNEEYSSPPRPPPLRHSMAKAHGKETKMNLAKFRRDDLYLILPPQLTEDHMISAYNVIVTSMRTFDLPIRDLEDLTPTTGTTCPPEEELTLNSETIATVGRELYNKLAQSVPKECTTLREIIVLHGSHQNGYRTLYHMMAMKCNSLKHIPEQWGPKWEREVTPHVYATKLQTYTAHEAKKGRRYTDVELASEMIQQAMNHPQYEMMGHTLLAQIMGMASPTGELPSRFSLPNLAATFQQYQARQLLAPTSTARVNKVNTGNSRTPRRSNNHVQCEGCHRYGHNIGDQICHFSAQLFHANKWVSTNPSKAQNNATAFSTANTPRTVNRMEEHFPERFHPQMTTDEREATRYQLATIFLQSDDDDTATSDPELISNLSGTETTSVTPSDT